MTQWRPPCGIPPSHNQRRGIQHHRPTHSISSRSIVSRVDHNHPTQAILSLPSHPFLHLRSQGLAKTIIFSSQFSCLLFSIVFLFALHVEIHSPFTLGFILHVPSPISSPPISYQPLPTQNRLFAQRPASSAANSKP